MTTRAEAVEELKRTYTVLGEDLDAAVALGKHEDSRFARRTLVRTLFAFVEGLTNSLAAVAASSSPAESGLLAVGDLALLKEQSFSLDTSGEIVLRKARLPLLNRVRHVLRCYPRIHGASYAADFGGTGWNAFRRALELRDRLTHPRNVVSLVVSDDELEIIVAGSQWFQTTVRDLLRACQEADEQLR